MRRLWLIFAQTVTVCVAALFVLKTLRPDWLPSWQLQQLSPSTGSVSNPLFGAGPTSSGDTAAAPQAVASYADAAQVALPSVVHIFTSQEVRSPKHPFLNDPLFRHFFGDRFGEGSQRRSGLGSGVVVSRDGYVLTNNHVIESADAIEIASNDGQRYKATIVGTDPESDLAVLRIAGTHRLPAIGFGSSDSLRVGDVVLAIGNPFGVGQTVTSGIVSALGRTHLGINTFENFIQTDAAINPGNSGGALIDAQGRLVGINTAIYSQSGGSMGIGFAIPVSLANSVLEQIIASGQVTRGWIGIEVQDITPELAESFGLKGTEGALIAGVMRGSPAEQAGIRPGDVLTGVVGIPVKDPQAMLERIARLAPGESARVNIRRAGQDYALAVKVGKRPLPRREQ
ncbi:MAG: Do family serine endopeptidase [Rhodocyclaceae bacterium]|jgi:serine protease DegQ|nr:Do family serine endopeptidase [Rhodocyclaceae bacterium]